MCFKIKFIYKVNKDVIFNYMDKNNLNINEFCNICNITITEFSDIMKNKPFVDTIIFAKIIKLLNIKLNDLLM